LETKRKREQPSSYPSRIQLSGALSLEDSDSIIWNQILASRRCAGFFFSAGKMWRPIQKEMESIWLFLSAV